MRLTRSRIYRCRALVHVGRPVQREVRAHAERTVRLASGALVTLRGGQVPVLLEFVDHAAVGVARVEEVVGGMFVFAEMALVGRAEQFVGRHPAVAYRGDEAVSVGLCRTQANRRVPPLSLADLRTEHLWARVWRALRGYGWRA